MDISFAEMTISDYDEVIALWESVEDIGLREASINKCNILVFTDNEDGLGFWKADGWAARHDLHFLQKWTGEPGKPRRSC